MADESWVGVGVHALFVGHSLVGGDGVWGAVAPVPFVVRGFQRDGDVVSEQVDDVSLGRVGDRYEGRDVLVRIRDFWWLLVDPCAIRVNGGSSVTQNLLG